MTWLTPVQLSAMANTSCQSNLTSIKVICHLSLCESDLIPITMHMHAWTLRSWVLSSSGSLAGLHLEKPLKLGKSYTWQVTQTNSFWARRPAQCWVWSLRTFPPWVRPSTHVAWPSQKSMWCNRNTLFRQWYICTQESSQLTMQLSTSPYATTQAYRTPIPSHWKQPDATRQWPLDY